jgi:Rod binding domain-containing protein
VSGLDGISLSTPGIVPADVRKAGKEAEETYRAALGFERMLTEQLTKTLATGASAPGGGEDGEDGEDGGETAATSAYKDMLPGQLADAVTGAGGLGLAHDLYLTMRSAS